jgi:hypothetical protein
VSHSTKLLYDARIQAVFDCRFDLLQFVTIPHPGTNGMNHAFEWKFTGSGNNRLSDRDSPIILQKRLHPKVYDSVWWDWERCRLS